MNITKKSLKQKELDVKTDNDAYNTAREADIPNVPERIKFLNDAADQIELDLATGEIKRDWGSDPDDPDYMGINFAYELRSIAVHIRHDYLCASDVTFTRSEVSQANEIRARVAARRESELREMGLYP